MLPYYSSLYLHLTNKRTLKFYGGFVLGSGFEQIYNKNHLYVNYRVALSCGIIIVMEALEASIRKADCFGRVFGRVKSST